MSDAQPRQRSTSTPDGTTSLVLAVCGALLIASRRALPRRAANVATVAGIGLVGAAAWHPLVGRLREAGSRRRESDVRLSLEIDRPVEEVFAFCHDFENFPRFIGGLRAVVDHGDGRSHWSASTPTGDVIEWDAVTTKYVPNRVLAWHTVAGSPVHATGMLRFRPHLGHTCLDVELSYELLEPGPTRDALAALVTPPRTRQLLADLHKLATYLESASERDALTERA